MQWTANDAETDDVAHDNSKAMLSDSLSLQRKRSHRILPEMAFNPDTNTPQLAIMTDHVRSVGILSWTSSALDRCRPMFHPGICQDVEVIPQDDRSDYQSSQVDVFRFRKDTHSKEDGNHFHIMIRRCGTERTHTDTISRPEANDVHPNPG